MIDEQLEVEMIAMRREFHQIPELSFEEFKTSKKIKDYLNHFGIKEINNCTETGVVALIRGRCPGKTIALRVDIDALPITEENDFPYRSRHEGKMHACGHDAHIAIGLGLAKAFHENRENFCGNVKVIFQPAEEGIGGANPMIKAGVMENPHVDHVLGCHVWPEIPVGMIDLTEGATFASSDVFTLTLKGVGGHGGLPEKVNDCIYAGSKTATALKEFCLLEPYEKKTVISVCAFEAPSVHNVYPSTCVLKGTIRTLSPKIREQVKKDIRRIVNETLDGLEMPFELVINEEYPPLMNHKSLLKQVDKCANELSIPVTNFGPTMAAEDFAFFAQEVPSCHVKVGCGNEKYKYPLHHSRFEIDEASIGCAARLLEKTLLLLLQ